MGSHLGRNGAIQTYVHILRIDVLGVSLNVLNEVLIGPPSLIGRQVLRMVHVEILIALLLPV